MSSKMVGHFIVEALIAQGIDTAFGVPGESYLAVLDGFYQYREQIRFITCRQEGGAAFMAEAQGKISGRPGICFVTRGPGASNAAIGLHAAFQDSVPLILFVGDVGADCRHREAFQELDFASFFGPNTKGMAKLVERVDNPDRMGEAIHRAFACAMNGRPGPVVLVLPEDMLTQSTHALIPPKVMPAQPAVSSAQLAEFQQRLSAAKKPLLLLGSGWSPAAAQALEQFATRWNLPVCNAFRHQDSFDNHHPLYAGDVGLGINPMLATKLQQSDCLIALGCRLGEITTQNYTLLTVPRSQQQLIHIHPSAEELNRVYHADLAINAHVNAMAGALASLEAPPAPVWQDWTQQLHQDYLDYLQPQALLGLAPDLNLDIDMPSIIRFLQQHLPSDTFMTNGAGNFASWLHRYFQYHGIAKGSKTQLAPTSGAMGYGVPAGIAANLLTGKLAFTIAGDGDFLMNGQELATASQHGGKSIILLLNNGSYGTIRMHQEREYPTRTCGTDLGTPDYCQLAQAYGYHAELISSTQHFESALLAALARPQGSLLEIRLPTEIITTRASLSHIQAQALQRHSLS